MIGRAAVVALVLLTGSSLPLRADDVTVMARRVPRVANPEVGAGFWSPRHEAIEAVASQPPQLDRVDNVPRDVARSIEVCWHPPHEGDEITLRLSFRRDGSVFGKPRITYMRSSGGPDGAADLANSIYAAIAACSPLRFTPALGAAIAGRIFLIRFVAMRKEQRAAL